MSLLRPLEGFPRIFQSLFGELVPSQVVSLPMRRGGGKMRVLCELMEFGSSLMRVIWHSGPRPRWLIHLEAIP